MPFLGTFSAICFYRQCSKQAGESFNTEIFILVVIAFAEFGAVSRKYLSRDLRLDKCYAALRH